MGYDFKNAMEFLLFSYFGDISNPIKASINRAYVDMASHTLTGFKTDEEKWKCRYQTSQEIEKSIENIEYDNFSDWHKNLCSRIKDNYKNYSVELSYGQAQKWVNMALKYLCIFNSIFIELEDKKLFSDYSIKISENKIQNIQSFLDMFSIKDFDIPIDSYILGYLEEKNKLEIKNKSVSWSKMDENDYNEAKELAKELDMESENHAWIEFALKKKPDKNSYNGWILENNKS